MKKLSIIVIILIVLCSNPLFARYKTYGNFKEVQYIRNYDGDTITVNIAKVHPIIGNLISIRIAGIDTPEIRGKCELEKNLAYKAKALVRYHCLNGKMELKNVRRDKYFRIIADVYINGVNLANKLIFNGLAVPYNGGTKNNNWCY